MANKRRKAFQRGLWAEFIASLYLRLRGYKILKRRYKTPVGEIDIIALKNKTLVIMEVKFRTNPSDSLHAVTPRTQVRVEKAARHFLFLHPVYTSYDIRFDVLAFFPRRFCSFSFVHLDNAWRPRS